MKGIEVLYWAVSILICLSMLFAILLWCKSWRREEREESERLLHGLAQETARLSASLEMMEHTFASLQAADEQFTRQIGDMREAVQRLRTSLPVQSITKPFILEVPDLEETKAVPPDLEPPELGDDRYAQARALLTQGQSAIDVARNLDMGSAEVQMIARMMNAENDG